MTDTQPDAVAPVTDRLTAEQYEALAAPIDEDRRVRRHDDGTPWIEGADVRRCLTRIFGYGGWGRRTTDKRQLGEELVTVGEDDAKAMVWRVTREVTVLLTVTFADGSVGEYDGTAAVTVDHAVLGQAHNDATNTAETYALKRAAVDFGDTFGLGLRAGVVSLPYVGGSLVRPEGTSAPTWLNVDDPEPDSPPAEVEDTSARPVTAAEGARRVAAASVGITTRPIADLAAELKASIQRARAAARADTESSALVTK